MLAGSRSARNTSTKRRSRVLGISVILALGLTLGMQGPSIAGPVVSTPAGVTIPSHDGPTTVRLSTFNLLGADHTGPHSKRRYRGKDGKKHRYASGTTRMHWAVRLLNRNHIDVVGFQEMRQSQYDAFNADTGSSFSIYPGKRAGKPLKSNSIAWRSSQWQLVEGHSMKIEYFCNKVPMPYVLLRNRSTGRLAWFYNSHNPASVKRACGSAQKRRDRDVQREINLVQRLRSEDPTTPVFITGDKNDRSRYFCPMVQGSEMHAANGGTGTSSTCSMPPGHVPVDWIMGSRDVQFRGYQQLNDALVRKTTDHRFVFSDAYIPPLASEVSKIDHVVVVSVDGLRGSGINWAGPKSTPVLHRMIRRGAWTNNARTDRNRVTKLPNVVSMLTGLRATPSAHGHGVGYRSRPQTTVNAAAGRYVSSVLGVTHDFGRSTALLTSDPSMEMIQRSWNSHNGVPDPYLPRDGRNRITHFFKGMYDTRVVMKAKALIGHSNTAFMFVQLSAVAQAGEKHGWSSKEYRAALHRADTRIGQISSAINASSRFRGHTILIVTSARGGSSARHPARAQTFYRVPILVEGPGVPAGTGLYDLNRGFRRPGHFERTDYSGKQPIRTSYLANLATRLLGEPAIPGSTMDPGQSLHVLASG